MTNKNFLYTFVHHKDEYELCRMEMRAFFGFDTKTNYLFSDTAIDPDRSPFIEERLEIIFRGQTLSDIEELVQQLGSQDSYKVISLNNMDLGETKKIPHSKRRTIERQIGLAIDGEPELDHPKVIFGLVTIDGYWYFGKYVKSESIWRKHLHKPHSYSTALSTRVARGVANIAIPHPKGIRAIDPCCGIGTVLVEALSMQMNIEGRDINPIVCKGARENIAYFDLDGVVTKGPISEITDHYDVAIIDLPYNLYTHITPEEQFDIMKHARRIADRVVFVTIETIDEKLQETGFTIIDRCIVKKQLFKRQILLCV